MIRLFLNAVGMTAGGGRTHVSNILHILARRPDIGLMVLGPPGMERTRGLPRNVAFLDNRKFQCGTARRFRREQRLLPDLITSHKADILISLGNFALFNSPVPQILVTGNALYTCRDFYSDLLARKDYRMWADTFIKGWFAKQSVKRADWTVTPTRAFADDIKRWVGGNFRNVGAIPFGFNPDFFSNKNVTLPKKLKEMLRKPKGEIRLLLVSYYNYYRNFDTLLRALPLIKQQLGDRPVKLVLTCELKQKPEWGPYNVEKTAHLADRLGIRDDIIELGLVPYHYLHEVYASCDIYVTPSYVETFAHPLVEAMASGLPVVASDIPVHMEGCRNAALYFPRFSSRELADRVTRIIGSPSLANQLKQKGLRRSGDYSWEGHVEELVKLIKRMMS